MSGHGSGGAGGGRPQAAARGEGILIAVIFDMASWQWA
jgi:hypothetical protein